MSRPAAEAKRARQRAARRERKARKRDLEARTRAGRAGLVLPTNAELEHVRREGRA